MGQRQKSSLPCSPSVMGAREFEILVGSAAPSAGRVWTTTIPTCWELLYAGCDNGRASLT